MKTKPTHASQRILTGYPTYAWKGFAGSVLRLSDPKAECLLDITGALGLTLNGLCLDGGLLGEGVHGVMVNKPDYGTTEDSPRTEG